MDREMLQRYVASAHSVVADITNREVRTISTYRWLHYVRRLPREWAEHEPVKESYLASLLDALTTLAGAGPDPASSPSRFRVDPRDGEALCRVLVGAAVLGYLQHIYAFVGMGAECFIDPTGLPHLRPGQREFHAALDEHARRLTRLQENWTLLPLLGTIGYQQVRANQRYNPDHFIGLVNRSGKRWRLLSQD
jgi:hypothetical protein